MLWNMHRVLHVSFNIKGRFSQRAFALSIGTLRQGGEGHASRRKLCVEEMTRQFGQHVERQWET